MDDWRLWLTREEHEHASIEDLKKLLAAERALMEKITGKVMMIDASPAGSLNAQLKREALALLEKL